MPKNIFRPPKSGESKLYTRTRDWSDPHSLEFKNQLEEMVKDCQKQGLLFKGYTKCLPSQLHQRWWEMYLMLGLHYLGFAIRTSPKNKGPDLLVEVKNIKIWVEAIAPNCGNGPDQVPEPVYNGVAEAPFLPFLLRLISAVNAKRAAFEKYLDEGQVDQKDALVVALSACSLNQFATLLDSKQRAPLQFLAGEGPIKIRIDPSTRKSFSSVTYRPQIRTSSGKVVGTDLFSQPEFSIISGVLYSIYDPMNAPPPSYASFSLFLNPRAQVKLPDDLTAKFTTWRETRRGDGEIGWTETMPVAAPT